MIERIDIDDWQNQHGHIYRYELARGFLRPGEKVLDAACGIGYGARIIAEKVSVDYVGADLIEADEAFAEWGTFLSGINFDRWEPWFEWDVSVSFETLEHVQNPEILAETLKKAKRLIILSTPTRPTKHINKYHLHDFTVDDVLELFADCKLVHLEDQPEELSHIFVFETPERNVI
jgi:2-polyprenyl-3-methyl-5-hydroxy-6-metoxy-1,4-benzoquinol methylase